MAVLAPEPKAQFLDANGAPLAGGKVYTYAAGTTTPLATYTNAGGLVPNTNPVILDARGEADLWYASGTSYKVILKDANDATIWTVDNIATTGTMALQNANAVNITGGTIGSGVTFNGNTTGTASNVTGIVAVANGGTNATTAADARTNLGAAASGANTDITALDQDVTITATGTIGANTIGYRGAPQEAKTGAYGLVLSDAGKHISITTGGVTIPANTSQPFPIGTIIGIYNNSSSNQTIAITTDRLRLAGTGTGGLGVSRTLAQYGFASLLKVDTTEWIISGAGVS